MTKKYYCVLSYANTKFVMCYMLTILQLENMFIKHCAPNHLLAHEDSAILAILLIILNQLTKYEAYIYIILF